MPVTAATIAVPVHAYHGRGIIPNLAMISDPSIGRSLPPRA